MGHLGHDEAMEVGGCDVDPRPWHYSRPKAMGLARTMYTMLSIKSLGIGIP